MTLRKLRALNIAEERTLAGHLAGILWLTGGLTALALLALPGLEIRDPALVLGIAAVAGVYGIAELTVVPWERTSPIVSHMSSALGLVSVVVAMYATGGAQSPVRFYLFFVVFYCSYFYPPREAVPYLVGCVLVNLAPLLYDPEAIDAGLFGELVIVVPTYAVLGALILRSKALLLTLRAESDRLALRDPLTDLLNRRALLEGMRERVGELGTTGLVLADLDGFKDVNTVHGYPAGDRVLRETAHAVRRAARDAGLVARLGGDEFAVLVAPADEDAMRALAHRILSEVRAMGQRLDLEGVELTVSVGWALYPKDTSTIDELIAAADFGIRAAKLAGKNRAEQALSHEAASGSS